MKKLTVLSRTYCHLCDDLITALQTVQSRVEKGAVPGAGKFSIEVIDIDLHPNLEVQWGDKVPVLLGKLAENDANHNEICHYFLDEAKLFAYLVLPSQAEN